MVYSVLSYAYNLYHLSLTPAINLYFRAPLKMWFPMLASSALGFTTLSIFDKLLPYSSAAISLPTTVAALVVGVVSNFYARIWKDIAVGPLLSGIMFLVPGSLAVKSSLEFTNRFAQVFKE